ncbi:MULTISPECIES: hypothetical protein [unclassified Bacillus (in: firmicutes)]|uniref:hypothetical protein n=1 Tax=unclassified Bacillus (in: firmicutes) TaxID=185979 RepID=UPI001BEBE305|nr:MULTISPECIES: hypothetical protein [unclassified Bacillus (in: firmicutes)]MBT2614091.1 hypothetical protein [Bacillus sp. ISL-78]MBT2629398.1 hypothetical protein [Bacillus sp. ISL-101]
MKPNKLDQFMYAVMKAARRNSLMELLEEWEISEGEYEEIKEWFWQKHKVNL